MAFNLPLVLTAVSVGLSTGLIIHYFGSKKDEEEEAVVTASGAPNENIVQNHLNIALLNVF